jgi:hypothetical protein
LKPFKGNTEKYFALLENVFGSVLNDEGKQFLKQLVTVCEEHPDEHLNLDPLKATFDQKTGTVCKKTPKDSEVDWLVYRQDKNRPREYNFPVPEDGFGGISVTCLLASKHRLASPQELEAAPQTYQTRGLLLDQDILKGVENRTFLSIAKNLLETISSNPG